MRRLLNFLVGAVCGCATGIGFVKLVKGGHWPWAVGLLAGVVLAGWLFIRWALSDGHLYAVYKRRQRRELRKAARP